MSIRSIKLYHYPLSRSARVKWLLHELLGDDFETERVALMQGAHYSEDFLAKNPNHAVPVLDIDFTDGTSKTMFESGAMILLLADAYKEKGLAPAPEDLLARADYLQMVYFGGAWMDMMLWQIRLHEDLLPKAVRSERVAAFNRDKFMNEVEPQLKARLEKHAHICGEDFTAADCMIGQNINWARAYKMCQDPVFKNYMSRVSKREGFIKGFADAKDFGS